MGIKAKPIPEFFKKYGYHFKVLQRSKNVLILRGEKQPEGIICYEVHIVRIMPNSRALIKQPSGAYSEIKLPRREVLATTEEFGSYGWSFDNLSSALKKYKELGGGEHETK